MDSHGEFKHLEVKDAIGVMVIRVLPRSLTNQTAILDLHEEFLQLLGKEDTGNVLLNLGSVEAVSSLMLSKLIGLESKIRSMGGKLVLCSLQRRVYELFAVTKLKTIFDIKSDEAEALASF